MRPLLRDGISLMNKEASLMKKSIVKNLMILCVLPLACMCNKEVGEQQDINDNTTIKVSVPAETKVSMSQGEGVLTLAWQDGDALMVVGNTQKKYELDSFEGAEAVFHGSKVGGSSFDVYYPGTYASKAALIARSYAGQVQNGNANTGHLEFNALVEGLDDYSTVDFASTGSKLNGVLKLVVKLPDYVTEVSSISLASAAGNEIFFLTNDANGSKTSALSLDFTEGTVVGSDHVLTAYIMTSWNPVTIAADTKLALKVEVPGTSSYFAKTISNPSTIDLSAGACLNVDISDATVLVRKLSGSGMEADPYLLSDVEDMKIMREYLVAGQTTYFNMTADIDMASIENWEPLNAADPYSNAVYFDGKGYKISNMTSKADIYPSFFGVLNGTLKNVTFDGCTVVATGEYTSGILAGYGGNANGSIKAYVTDVNVTNASVTHTKNDLASNTVLGVGGLFGTVGDGTFKNLVFEGTVDNQITCIDSATDNLACTGGFCGDLRLATATIENITIKGTVKSKEGRYTGGFVGYARAADTTFKNCTNEASVTSANVRVGGICGHFQGGKIEGCTNKGNVSSTVSGDALVAGIIGFCSESTTITKCVNTGNVTGQNLVAGIIASNENTVTVTMCSANAEIYAKGQIVGGILAGTNNGNVELTGARAVVIENCWTSGKLICAGGQCGGGIAGEISTSGSKIEDCWSDMEVSGQRVLGGILGRSCLESTSETGWDTTLAISNGTSAVPLIRGCVAWNPSITCTDIRPISECGGSGAVIGYTSFKNFFENCYRRSDMSFTPSDSASQTLVDQPNCDGNNWTLGSIDGTASTYCAPYHGVAAASSKTVSDLAAEIGWSTDVWTLAGDKPAFK